MIQNMLLTRADVAKRWRCSTRKVDRLRAAGELPWLDITAKKGKRPVVRFSLEQIVEFEGRCSMDINLGGQERYEGKVKSRPVQLTLKFP